MGGAIPNNEAVAGVGVGGAEFGGEVELFNEPVELGVGAAE